MKNRRILIVGGGGFIGRYVVRRLAARGAAIAVVSPHAVNAGFLRPMGDVGQIATLNGSVTDERLLATLVPGIDTVICAAGILVERGSGGFGAVHRRGARLAAPAGVRQFVHISALGADAQSQSSYARSKAAGEAAVLAHFPAATIL